MRTLFKVLRGFFYFLSIITGVIYLRGDVLFSSDVFELIKSFLIPWYLIFCWLMLWYLIATCWVWRDKYQEDINKEKIGTKSFIIGCACGLLFALLYLFV